MLLDLIICAKSAVLYLAPSSLARLSSTVDASTKKNE